MIRCVPTSFYKMCANIILQDVCQHHLIMCLAHMLACPCHASYHVPAMPLCAMCIQCASDMHPNTQFSRRPAYDKMCANKKFACAHVLMCSCVSCAHVLKNFACLFQEPYTPLSRTLHASFMWLVLHTNVLPKRIRYLGQWYKVFGAVV